jgi:hypothetical protein
MSGKGFAGARGAAVPSQNTGAGLADYGETIMFAGKITLERLRDTGFLRRMAPDLHVQDDTFYGSVRKPPLSMEELDAIGKQISTEGYFELSPTELGVNVDQMANLVKLLVGQGMPSVFAFLYDEYWAIYNALDPVLKHVLGANYKRLPDFWCWHVDPKKSESGWDAHRDKDRNSIYPDGRPKSLTIWIPLTEATPLNGCMYLVPADRDPQYFRDGAGGFKVQDVRALPGRPGTVFMWTQNVFHWGSHASPRAPEPRVSIAMEFQSGDVAAMNSPLTSNAENPSMKMRHKLISKQMLQYKHMYPLLPEMERWAKAA